MYTKKNREENSAQKSFAKKIVPQKKSAKKKCTKKNPREIKCTKLIRDKKSAQKNQEKN